MRKIFTILSFFILHSLYSQLYITGKAQYTMKVTGNVQLEGSPCGDGITGGLQYFVGKYEKNTPPIFFRKILVHLTLI